MSDKNILVYSSVGSLLDSDYQKDCFLSWQMEFFDSICVRYSDANNFNYAPYFKIQYENKDFKFPNLLFITKNIDILKYDYIVCIDDDLKFNQTNTINTVINYMTNYNLNICTISNDCVGKKSSYDIMNSSNLINELWITNFCEMGCLFFDTRTCASILEQYENNYSEIKDYGIDHMIFNVIDNINTRCGIIKNLTFYNPNQPSRDTKIFGWIINKSLKNLNRVEPHIIETIETEK